MVHSGTEDLGPVTFHPTYELRLTLLDKVFTLA